MIANHAVISGSGQINATITYNLPAGYNRIEILVGNTGGPTQILLMGDIVDNDTVKFA